MLNRSRYQRRNLFDDTLDLDNTRDQLRRATERLEQYQAALRLANVEIKRRNRNVIALMTFAYQANRTADPTTLLKLALVQALETTGTPVGAIVVIDKQNKDLTLGVHRGLTKELSAVLTGQQLGAGAVTLMPHLVSGAGALLEYHTTDDQMERLLLASGNLTSLVSLPLQIGPRLAGAFLVGLQNKKSFTSAELCFLMALAQETAVALESLNLRESLWRTAEMLLGSDGTKIATMQEIGDTELDLSVPTPFELPDIQPTSSEQISEDLEQLLEAMMEAEAEVQQQNEDLQTLTAIAATMNNTLDLKRIMQRAVDETRTTLNTDAAWLYLLTETEQLELRAHTGLSATYVRAMYHLKLSECIEGRAVIEKKTAHIDNTSEDERHTHKIWVDKEGLLSIAAVPLMRPEPIYYQLVQDAAHEESEDATQHMKVIGVLAVGRRSETSRPWNPREMRMLNSIVNPVAMAVESARLQASSASDETNHRLGNQVLKEVNELLLEENSNLSELVNSKIGPAIDASHNVLNKLDTTNPTQAQHVATLRRVMTRLQGLIAEAFPQKNDNAT